MKIAILGGGFTGLTTAYKLAKQGHQVTIFEKEKTLGGLAAGFKRNSWDWYLEKTIHHLFANDNEILNFAREVGFDKIFFKKPQTGSLYKNLKHEYRNSKQYLNPNVSMTQTVWKIGKLENWDLFRGSPCLPAGRDFEFRIFPLDTPQDLLTFPLLSLSQKIRTGAVLAFLKLSPFLPFYERYKAEQFLKKTMGEECWNILWHPLFRKKFGKYAGKILSSFFWARIKKRTKKLGYIEGGFQNFIDYLEDKLKNLKVKVVKGFEIKKIVKAKEGYRLMGDSENFKIIISTLPTPVLAKISEGLFPSNYLSRLKKINYLHALSLILETDKPILPKTYWLNIAAEEVPIMGVFQQTNFIDKKYYGGKHICYLGWYVEEEDERWKMNKQELINFVSPSLKKISNIKYQISNIYLFKSSFAQPIFDKEFIKNKPNFLTPLKNFYIANLDMTYPYDRGTNYAVRLGGKVVEIINKEKSF